MRKSRLALTPRGGGALQAFSASVPPALSVRPMVPGQRVGPQRGLPGTPVLPPSLRLRPSPRCTSLRNPRLL